MTEDSVWSTRVLSHCENGAGFWVVVCLERDLGCGSWIVDRFVLLDDQACVRVMEVRAVQDGRFLPPDHVAIAGDRVALRLAAA